MGHHRLKAAAGASPADPYFSSTSLLLLGNGTNGGQNNTFVDSSTNNFTVQRYGNVTQGSFSPFSAPDGRWSVSFDGSGDYLSVSNPSNLSFGTGAFTVEFWMNWSGTTASPYMGVLGPHNGTSQLYGVFLDASGNIGIFLGGATFGNTLAAAVKPTPGKWMHIVSCRDSSGVHRFYADGVLKDTTTDTTNLVASGGFNIGVDGTSARPPFSGQISNLRVLSSTALYTGSSITPSTSPLTAVSGTSLLTCQSNRFLDKSTNAVTITPSGNAAATSFSPFAPLAEYSAGSNGGSGYFDGSGDYLSNSSLTAIGSGDYTFECWANSSAANFTDYQNIFYDVNFTGLRIYFGGTNSGGGGSTNNGLLVYHSGTIIFQHGSISLNTWTHIAIARSGTTVRLFIDGTLIHSITSSANLSDTSYRIGGTGTIQNFNGFLSNLRLLIGTAQYTSTFTPPTSPLTAITNTSLLLNFTNAGIIDSTAKNDLETVGDAQISTSVKKFGTGSIKLDGAGDYLSLPSNSNLSFGTGDFTIECWAYVLGTSSGGSNNDYGSFADFRTANASQVNVLWCFLGGSAPIFYVNGSTRITGSNITLNTWTHLALCRSSGVTKMFMDGTQVGSSYTDTNNYTSTVARIGGNINGDSFLYGYLDDYRISKYARYPSAFTPPSAQLPAR